MMNDKYFMNYLARILGIQHAQLAVLVHMHPNVSDHLLALVVDGDVDRNLLPMIPHLSVKVGLKGNVS